MAHTAWVRRAAAHPQVVAALAEGHILSESVARTICKWTDKLPEDYRPASIRNAVILRDKHCRWTGGCDQPASACEVHHVTHKANGGKTSVEDCILFCTFHHQVVIHRWDWTVVLNPDGTTTAWNPDKTKVPRSRSLPTQGRLRRGNLRFTTNSVR